MSSYTPQLDELRAAVDERLAEFLSGCRSRLEDNGPLIDELKRMIDAGGKRLRPAFCYWGFRAAGESHCDEIVTASASLELLHTFALVHDDIMDGADERRGEPTVHSRHGLSVGVLAGDLALVLADSCLFGSGFEGTRMDAALGSYLVMRQEVIAGQYLDVRATDEPDITEAEVRRIAVLKSGRYSVEKPLAIGAHLGLADEALIQSLATFGEPLGEAFQFRDDLLGTFGERASVGKPIDSDIREGKRNLLYARTIQALDGEERALFAKRWGRGDALSDDDIATLRSLVEKSGARASIETLVDELAAGARSVLEATEMPGDARAALDDLVDLSLYRRT